VNKYAFIRLIFSKFLMCERDFCLNHLFGKELFFKNSISLIIPLLLIGSLSSAQSLYPYTVNSAGNQVAINKYSIEWSVGESSAVDIMDNNDQYLFTNGFLQYNVENQKADNLIPSFLSNEIRLYPNPVRNELSINLLHASKGNHQIELLDAKGSKLKEIQIKYNGMGALENWNLSGLKAGHYFLNIRHTDGVTGKLKKNGVFKILKVN
jgi:hypothetical protein